MNEPKFDPLSYEAYRPLYPSETFQSLNNALRYSNSHPLRILDLGCGTGAALESFLRSISPEVFSSLQICGVDPDPSMLEAARARFRSLPELAAVEVEWKEGSADSIPALESSFDVILIGSAYHWFPAGKSLAEISRVSASGAHALLFEYQFPKALQHPELNEWTKRNFNQLWKAPQQTPRGSLKEISKAWREDPAWKLLTSQKPPMIRRLDADAFFGHLRSQSRYLHYELGLSDSERQVYRRELKNTLQTLYKGEAAYAFDFYLTVFHLNKVI